MAHNLTVTKLAQFTDARSFEQLCSSLLVKEYPKIIPLGGPKDGGRDAVEPSTIHNLFQTEDGGTIFQFSLEKTWKSKLRRELKKVFENGYHPSNYVFVSNQSIGTHRDEVRQHASRTYGVNLETYDIEWLRARLENPDYIGIRRQYLGLDETSLPAFLSTNEFAERRIDQDLAPDLPLFLGREAQVARIKSFLQSGRKAIVVIAPPGLGKTKLLLEVGREIDNTGATQARFLRPETESLERHFDELDPNSSYVLFVDDGQELQQFRQLLALMLSPEFKDKLHVIIAAHPWVKDKLKAEFESRGLACEEMDLDRLANADIDLILQHASLGVTDEQARAVIVRIAEGNPLVAVTAASYLAQTGSLYGFNRHQFLSAYFARALDLAFKDDRDEAYLTLAVLAATKGIEYEDTPTRSILAGAVGLSEGQLNVVIDRLKGARLVRHTWSRIRVIPDLLSQHILFEAFFSEGHPYDFEEKVFAPFFMPIGDRVLKSLAEAEAMGARSATSILNKQLSTARRLVAEADNLQRLLTLHWIKAFAYFRPEDCLVIIRSIVESPVAEPAKVQSRWGRTEITSADILRESTEVLSDTWRHCESCLRETIELLYIVAQQQDHSRSNLDPSGDSIGVLTKQVIPLVPGKPFRVQEVALELVASWVRAGPNTEQQKVIINCLSALFSVKWETTKASHVDTRTFTISQGFLKPTDALKNIRSQAIDIAAELYRIAEPPQKEDIIKSLGSQLGPYHQGALSEDIRGFLTNDTHDLFSRLMELTPPEAVSQRHAIWEALDSLQRFGFVHSLPEFYSQLYTEELDMFAHLTEWPGHRLDEDGWQGAEKRHNSYWGDCVKGVVNGGIDPFLDRLNGFAGQAAATGTDNTSAISANIGTICRLIRQHAPGALSRAVSAIPQKFPYLKPFAGAFLGELYALDHGLAFSVSKEWITGNDPILQREASRALLWVEQFGGAELEMVELLLALDNLAIDWSLVAYPHGHMSRLQQEFPGETVSILRTIAGRCGDNTLELLAGLLEPGGLSIIDVPPKDFKEIVMQFVRLESLSFSAQGMLERLYQLDHKAWIEFWESRIAYEKARPDDSVYWAAPFHMSRETTYVASSPHRLEVLGTFLEWSARGEYLYNHNGSTLFKLFSEDHPDAISDIIDSWIQTRNTLKLRAVARVLEQIGYGEYFLKKAIELLQVTGDDVVAAHLSDTVGTTGVVSGSMAPLFEARKADFEAWLHDSKVPIAAKVFAKRQIEILTRQAKLHAEEDRED